MALRGMTRTRILLAVTVAVSNFARDVHAFHDDCLKSSASASALRELMEHSRKRRVSQLYVNWHTTARKPLIRLKQPPGRFAYYQGAF